MKTPYKIVFIGIITLTAGLIFPDLLHASITGGGSISAELEITNIVEQIIEFITGPIALGLIILGLIGGGAMVAVSRQNDQAGWNRIGKVLVAGTLALGAVGLANLFFAGAVI